MRPIRVLVPGTTGRFRCGGLLVELQTARLISRIAPVQVVTYRQREAEHPFLEDLLRQEPLEQILQALPGAQHREHFSDGLLDEDDICFGAGEDDFIAAHEDVEVGHSAFEDAQVGITGPEQAHH